MIMLYVHRYNKFYGLSDEGQILVIDDKEIQHRGFIDICNYIEKYGTVERCIDNSVYQDIKNFASC